MSVQVDTCDHCQKVTQTADTDYGRLCKQCLTRAEFDNIWGEPHYDKMMGLEEK